MKSLPESLPVLTAFISANENRLGIFTFRFILSKLGSKHPTLGNKWEWT